MMLDVRLPIRLSPISLVLALVIIAAPETFAQEPEVPPAGSSLAAVAVRTGDRPVLDGDVLDDPAWAKAPPITRFWQTTPNEGAPASENTEVRVVFSADTLYVGVVAYDRDPDQIIVADSRRD